MSTCFKHISLLVCFLLLCFVVAAQPFSYVYIQGDKVTPFYVKMEGQIMPRYGKNYCILSELNPGTIHIEILFQQNVYASQKFTVQVPGDGCRGFLLTRQGVSYQLYDLQTKEYLNADSAETNRK